MKGDEGWANGVVNVELDEGPLGLQGAGGAGEAEEAEEAAPRGLGGPSLELPAHIEPDPRAGSAQVRPNFKDWSTQPRPLQPSVPSPQPSGRF